MSDPFGGLNDAFGTEPSELTKHVEKVKPSLKKSETEDVRTVSYTHLRAHETS